MVTNMVTGDPHSAMTGPEVVPGRPGTETRTSGAVRATRGRRWAMGYRPVPGSTVAPRASPP